MLKKVVLHSVATALASIVLPVPINANNRNSSNLELPDQSYHIDNIDLLTWRSVQQQPFPR